MRAVGLGRPLSRNIRRRASFVFFFFSYKALRVATGNGPDCVCFFIGAAPWDELYHARDILIALFIKIIFQAGRKNMLHNALIRRALSGFFYWSALRIIGLFFFCCRN